MPADDRRNTAGSTAHFPGRTPIDGYGDGGFRFAGMSHRGSILCLPSGIYAWEATDVSTIDVALFDSLLERERDCDHLLLGTGARLAFPQPGLRAALAARGIALEPMDTGAACRTYNILLGEKRAVAAALIATG